VRSLYKSSFICMSRSRPVSLSAFATAAGPRALGALPGTVLEFVAVSTVLLRAAESLHCSALTSFCSEVTEDERLLVSDVRRWFSACSVAFCERSGFEVAVRTFWAASSFLSEAIISSWSARGVSNARISCVVMIYLSLSDRWTS
jgi:hypothetical protein